MGLLGGMLGALGPGRALLGPASGDWWSQFQPHDGGVTGQPSVDPSQLQTAPGTTVDPSFLKQPPSGYTDMPVPTTGSMGSTAIMNPTPGPIGVPTQSMLDSLPPGYKWPFQGGSPGNSAFGQAGGNGINSGGMMGGFLGQLGPQVMQGARMAQMRTPSGRVLSVPMQHIQEALARGAQHL